jgi:NDP-sugar pyrophosphorylase family protein
MRVIIQAGGKGTRLHPYTHVLPKPLMPIEDMPILEIVIRQLVYYGFTDIVITVGHLGHLLMAVFGDGKRWGARIEYNVEDEPRGTLGAIAQVGGLHEPFLVMNGDLLTDLNYRRLYEQHLESKAQLSIGVYQKPIPISLGVLELDARQQIVGFREKPILQFPCSMGVYVFNPELVRLVPARGTFGFDDLMLIGLKGHISMHAFLFDGLWLDIGRAEDYAQASQLLTAHRARLLPEKAAEAVNR